MSSQSPSHWATRRAEKHRRLARVASIADGVVLPTERIVDVLQNLIAPGDRVVVEGNNQKQADFLSRALARVDPGIVNGLHLIIPSVSRVEHLDLFERGIARKLDFAYAGTQSLRISQFLQDGILEIGAIHTYIELFARRLFHKFGDRQRQNALEAHLLSSKPCSVSVELRPGKAVACALSCCQKIASPATNVQ